MLNSTVIQANGVAGIHQAEPFIIDSGIHVKPFVFILDRFRRPTAIVRRIATIIIKALNRMRVTWPWPHVGKKISKCFPSFTDRNPATTVLMKTRIDLVFASLVHVAPTSIFRRCGFAFGVSMRHIQATATFHAPIWQIMSNDKSCSSAFAPAFPANSSVRCVSCPRHNQKSTKLFSDEINTSRHATSITALNERSN